MRNVRLVMTVALVLMSGTQFVSAEDTAPLTPLMLSLATPVQAPSPEFDVAGLRIDLLYGRCRNMCGLDAGLVNHTTGDETALAAGLVNYVEKDFSGLQVGAANLADGAYAMQIGFYNGADDIVGMQIGVINHARLMRGLQIGVINVIESNDISFFPIINFFF